MRRKGKIDRLFIAALCALGFSVLVTGAYLLSTILPFSEESPVRTEWQAPEIRPFRFDHENLNYLL